jgi:hypothetical protein
MTRPKERRYFQIQTTIITGNALLSPSLKSNTVILEKIPTKFNNIYTKTECRLHIAEEWEEDSAGDEFLLYS